MLSLFVQNLIKCLQLIYLQISIFLLLSCCKHKDYNKIRTMGKPINKNHSHSNNHKNHSNNHKNNNKKPHKIEEYDLKTLTIQELYDAAENAYKELRDNNKNDKWNQFISQKGTKKDKITFVAAQILKKPQASLQNFQMLAKWTLDNNHNFALPACQALSNIYTEHVFVQKKSLKIFLDSVQEYIKQNKKDTKVGQGDLVGFYLEHHIKHFYGQMIRGLTQLLTSTISHIKKTAVQILANMSRYKQLRRTILSTLINKFGDSDLQIVNQVSKSLKSQFYEDIQASQTLLEQSQAFLFREHLSQKSQFYVVNFLNNVNLKYFSQKSLSKLFELFFHFFNKLMEKQTQDKSISSRLFLNSIKGLNKIFAFMKTGNKQTLKVIQSKVQTVYKTFHKTQNTKAKVQLLLFLFQSCTNLKGSISDRFYRVLYEFLSSNQILHCSIAQMFFDLLLICLKQDQNLNRTLAFIKRILQLCFEAQSNFIVTCLILINKVILEKESLQVMIKQKQNIMQEQDQQTKQSQQKTLPYDMNKRQPLFAGAQKTNLWQLTVFRNHYHPTVRKFIEHIFKNQQIPYSGSNPLIQLSLTSFVQKMSLRKQKKSDSWKIKVKRNLSRIRTSKYESMLEKPLQSFKQNQEFIKKYLQKRETIHKNKKAMHSDDIQDFADEIIQKELDRLNPRQEDFDDLSISPQQISQEDPEEEVEDFQQGGADQFSYDLQQNDQDLEGDEIIQQGDNLQAQEFGDDNQIDGQEFDDQAQFDDNLADQFDEDQDMDQESQDIGEEEKQFQDVFDDINDQQQYRKKKNKNINKNRSNQSKNKKPKFAAQNHKNASYKNKKKQFKKNFNKKQKR